ncbi:MAG: hypothetical protein KF906_07835 [Actinobacteria bacterium]|nr:hypothetical protein [Actinomycetota bacterium]
MKRRSTVAALAAALLLALTACDIPKITAPHDGAIVDGDSTTVTGKIRENADVNGTLTVNGVSTPINPDRTFSVDLPLGPDGTVTVVEAIYTSPAGKVEKFYSTVVSGPSIDVGEYSVDGVGMRFTNTGLNSLGPIINDLASGSFDISGLILAQQPLVHQQDAFLTFDITGNAYEASMGGVNLTASSSASGMNTNITISNLAIGLDLLIDDGMLIQSRCKLEVNIPQTTINARFDLQPAPGDPSHVDVNLIGTPTVNTSGVTYEFLGGICDGDAFLIGDIVNAVAGPQISTMIGSGFSSQLGDPDGSGPADSPIADAIETALAQISIAGSVGEAVNAHLDAPFTQITEGATALDLRSNADFYATRGTNPGDCAAVPGAPTLPETFDVPGTYPTLGSTTPSGAPYGLGLVISASTFNQLLGAMTECGLLNQDITELDLAGTPLPITSTVLAGLVPQFSTLPANTPMKIRVTPKVAPFLTSAAGPNGESSELKLAGLWIEFIETRNGVDIPWLRLSVSSPLGFELGFDEANGTLAPTITPGPSSQVQAKVIDNNIGANTASIETLFPALFPNFVSGLSSSFAAFPMPSFLGLNVDVVELARQGNYFVLYADLLQVPQTRIQNVQVTDTSTANGVYDSIVNVHEWRHKVKSTSTSKNINVSLRGMIGADACCTVDDAQRDANAGYRVTFDVVPENGETWHLDMNQVLRGAHTLIDEQGGSARTSMSAITVRAKVGSGAWQNFNITPSSTGVNSGSGAYVPFTGSSSRVLTGTTAQTITVEVAFDVHAYSDSNIAFPAVAGDEAAIRFGVNDSITNGFTAGEYPGVGNRSIGQDGLFGTIVLTAVP